MFKQFCCFSAYLINLYKSTRCTVIFQFDYNKNGSNEKSGYARDEKYVDFAFARFCLEFLFKIKGCYP